MTRARNCFDEITNGTALLVECEQESLLALFNVGGGSGVNKAKVRFIVASFDDPAEIQRPQACCVRQHSDDFSYPNRSIRICN